MPIDIIIVGALGRMGKEIAEVIFSDESVNLKACVEYAGHPQIGTDYGVCLGKGTIGVPVVDSVKDLDFTNTVLIDFSTPQSTRSLLETVFQKKVPTVIGTTGLSDADIEQAKAVAKNAPVIISPNMSLGVNLLFSLTQLVASKLKDEFDIEIIEAHHRFKKDAPSGTARKIAEIAAEAIGSSYEKSVINGRAGITDTDRSSTEIGVHAVRGGDIVGDHTVLFAGMGERIELRHMAHNRSVLARGAVRVAKWLADKNAGFYTMNDMLGI